MARKQPRRITSSQGSGKGSSGARKSKSVNVSIAGSTRSGKSARDRLLHTTPISKRYRAPRPSSLNARQLQTRANVLAAHSDMMLDPDLTASKAARNNGVAVSDFWKCTPKAFKKDSSGRIGAVADRYLRRMEILGPSGPIVIKVKGYKAKTQFARHRNDVFRFLGGDRTALEKWKGVTIQGHELLTDPDIIRLQGEQENLPEHFGSEQVIPYSGGTA
jgi:hypothetical protein